MGDRLIGVRPGAIVPGRNGCPRDNNDSQGHG
jgi:hypothetical protein